MKLAPVTLEQDVKAVLCTAPTPRPPRPVLNNFYTVDKLPPLESATGLAEQLVVATGARTGRKLVVRCEQETAR